MPADHEPDELERWLDEQVQPLPPPPGTFQLITRRARRRKIRRAVITAASAAAVAAAVAVAVPAGLSLNLNSPARGNLSAGQSTMPATRPTAPGLDGTATSAGTSTGTGGKTRPAASGGASSTTTPAAGATAGGGLSQPGALPANFTPSSVTWDSLSTGWVIGQAGTAGRCVNANPDICTSIARTSDGGQTWRGLPAPSTAGPEAAAGVTGLRFLNATYGWAYGPELWATGDGGQHWHQVSTSGSSVTDLETAGNRAYALFGTCSPPGGSTGDTIANCTSYTLMTATAGSDNWTAVTGVPAGLAASGGGKASAQIVLAGSAGYLVAPDGTLYTGPLDGGAWSKAAPLPPSCKPGPALASGLPSGTLLASAGGQKLGLVCAYTDTNGANLDAYWSVNGGATWTGQGGTVQAGGVSPVGTPESLAATSAGTLVLATETSAGDAGSLYLLSTGTAPGWSQVSLVNSPDNAAGFSYVGMTSATQGVALGASAGLHGIWMTRDGGQTWTYQPIQS